MSIRVDGLPPTKAHAAISAAFEEIKLVHRLMSFHDPESDVGRLNREGSTRCMEVHPYTFEVLKQAMAISEATDGCFDISVAAELVRWGWLPRPASDGGFPRGTWREIELRGERSVRFGRPLWIDLGGIAKGYAVDQAAERLRREGVVQAVINAGGDIRVLGRAAERIALRTDVSMHTLPVIDLAEGSVASSSGNRQRAVARKLHGPHVDGINRSPAAANRFVCVLAERCVIADALTKMVMVEGLRSETAVRKFEASAHVFDAKTGWRSVNSGMDRA